ncbi:Alpha/Beta hydrolase protein [Plectosphaerella plurivora]|uniref:Alpha/Beta hydrolase protein n=1 Tax=Plectosphaerella plurivora TaxID=936078 RepID=A0A9P8V1V1_9PEZI|nr:Alpha/Beta hydrolase protein [Plectosphaerella plurivora]
MSCETPFTPATPQEVPLPDGRVLSFGIFGAGASQKPGAGGVPVVFYFPGFPGSHDEAFMAHDGALAAGLQVVALDRPGFAGSTPQPTRRITDWPADVLAVADHFSIARFAIMGISGGGPYALACLRAIPRDRLAGVVVGCGMYPASYGTAGMRLPSRVMFTIAPWVPSIVAMVLNSTLCAAARNKDPKVFEDMLVAEFKSAPPRDHALLDSNVRGCKQALSASTRAAVIPGGKASAVEFALFGSPWGFDLKDVGVGKGRLVMWHGTEDVNVPYRMAEMAVKDMPDAELRTIAGEGHLGVVLKVEEIVGVLEGMLGEGSSQ